MAGSDPAGTAFGRGYDNSAAKVLEAMAVTRNGLCSIGDGVRMSAHNYSMAEAMSDVSGRGEPLPVPGPTGSVGTGSTPSAVGTGTGAPAGWGWVAPYIGMIWPSGDSTKLRTAAAAWISAGTNFEVSEIIGAAGPMGIVEAQQMPEGPAIAAALTDAHRSAAGVLQQCISIAAQLNEYADKIDRVHAAILDLLSRICNPMTGIKEVWDILTDEDEDEIRKIADDIRTVGDNFTIEVDALREQLAAAVSEATTVLTTMGHKAAKDWNQFLHGTDVGRIVDSQLHISKGALEEAGGILKNDWTYGPPRALVDPEGWYNSWREMVGGMAPLVGLGGDHAPGVGHAWKEFGKGLVHWDDWKKDPAEAAGKNLFDLATFFVPGGEAGAAAKGARGAAEAGEAAAKAAHGEVAASRGFGDVAKPVPAAPAPHAPHVEVPSPDRPPASIDTSGAPAPPKPGGSLPHSPTESRVPVGENPRAPGEHPVSTPAIPDDRVPSSHRQPLESAPSAIPGGHAVDRAPAAVHAPPPAATVSAPHAPTPGSAPAPHASGPPLPSAGDASRGGPTEPPSHVDDAPHGGGGSPEGAGEHHPPARIGPDEPAAGDHSSPVAGDHSGSGAPHAADVASNLNDAFVNGRPTDELAREVADLSTHHMPSPINDIGNVDRVVLGKWDGQEAGYIGEARRNGGIYFDTGGATWDAITHGLGEADAKVLAWRVNEQFLRAQLENGVSRIEYLLGGEYSSLEEILLKRQGSFSAMEIEYLADNAVKYGYTRIGNAWIKDN